MLKKRFAALALAGLFASGPLLAADYVIDTEGQHAFVNFKISHLGYSWLYGTFREFDGQFSYDPQQPADSQVKVTLQTDSVDTNHAERDKHLRSPDFLNVQAHPTATFASTTVTPTGEDTADIRGDLTLNGVTRPVVIAARFIGAGEDPWGGYRAGFSGSTTLKLKDFGIDYNLGPAAESVELILSVEGIRQ